MDLLKKISSLVAEGYQVQSVWIVPPASQIGRDHWEAHIKIADFVPEGEGCVNDFAVKIDHSKIPDGVQVTTREKIGDQIVTLPPMSDEQAEAIAFEIQRSGDASATHKTASGCWAIGPCATWCKDPLRKAILNSRKK